MKFLRRNWDRHSKLGRKRKKKQVWRKPKGRHNKMREKIRGRPASVRIGYKQSENAKNKLFGKKPAIVMNVYDLEKIKNNEIAIVGRVGMKKKIQIVNKAKEKNIRLQNINIKKFLESVEKKGEKK